MAPKRGSKLVPDWERKKHFVAVRLTDAEFKGLEAIAAKEELPLSYLIRKAIALLIEMSHKKRK